MEAFLQGLACASLTLSLSVATSQASSQSSAFANPEAAIRQLDDVVAGAGWVTEYQYLGSASLKDLEKARGCPYCDELKRAKQFIHQLAGDNRHNHNEL